MADELNKDVVGARIKLDTSSAFKAFQNMDQAVRGNAQSFQILNKELAAAHQSYASMAKSMDKLSLTSDERRKKIQAESAALIAQRKAQTELLQARAKTYDTKNQTEDAKLASQQALAKKRQDAVIQQEAEHQKKLATAQQSGQAKIQQQEQIHQQRLAAIQQKGSLTSSKENLEQIKIDRQFQQMKIADARLEMEAERHAVRMKKIADQGNNALINRGTFAQSAQYLMTGALYYNTVRGAQEAITVLKNFERSLVDIQRVMGSDVDIGFIKKSMISDAKEYGYALNDIAQVYVQIGQQGFNEQETAALARTALMAANVEESFKSAADAQTLLTGAILNYNMAATDSERLLDRLNEVSNDYATDSNKLLQGINRVGASAKNAGEDIDLLIGQLTVLNEAGFSGSVAGNAIKSFISFSSRDIAVSKLEKYVGTMKEANGEMMQFPELLSKISANWKTYTDVERAEITQAIARGDQASRFVALMNNYDKVLKVAATSENSFGSAQRENALAMTTLEKQSLQLKAAWDELVVSIGDSGLLGVIKAIVHEQKLLVDGFNSLPGPIRNTLTIALSLGAAIAVLNTGMKLMTGQSLVQLATGLVSGTKAMLGMKAATDAANVSQKAFIATPIGAALTALSVVVGVATLAFSRHKGAMNEVKDTMDETERDTYALAQKYAELKKTVDDNTKSDQEIKQAKSELSVVIEKISNQMPGLVSQWDAHGKAIDINTEKITAFAAKYRDSMISVESSNVNTLQEQKSKLEKDIQELNKKKSATSELANRGYDIEQWAEGDTSKTLTGIDSEILNKGRELAEIENKLENSRKTLSLLKPSVNEEEYVSRRYTGSTSAVATTKAKPALSEDELKELKADFDDQMNEFKHLVNVEADGYVSAQDQLARLREIRGQFGELAASDLYGIDEEIYRLTQGKAIDAKGLGGSETAKAFSLSLDDIDTIKKQVDTMINDSQSLIDMFSAQEFSLTDVSGKTDLYVGHQNKLHEANVMLQASTETLAQRQGVLNELYSAGKITSDEYNKASEDVQNRLTTMTAAINSNSVAWWNDQKAIKDIKEQLAADSFAVSEKWIAHQKAIRDMSVREELAAWVDVSSRYEQYSDQRMTADERIYSANKALIQEEEKALDDLVAKQKKYLDESKAAELKDISTRKEAFVTAQDEKIKAIERLIAAQDTANDDADYNKKLSEKQARLKVLEAGVGPEAIKERRDLAKEIEEMQLERQRSLNKRALETAKQALEDEKDAKEKSFDAEQRAVETHYDALEKAFDSYGSDIESKSEALKQIQVTKEAEKNTEILKNLDSFIAQYQAKMALISNLSTSQKDIDLAEYNSNKDRWEAANIRGDTVEMSRLSSRNDELRLKYGITQDTAKLQHFKEGGVVKGAKGQAVPVIAHADEMILNGRQQSNMYKLLDYAMPKVSWPETKFSTPQSIVNNYYSYDNSIGEVAVNGTNGVAGLYDQRSGLITRQQALGGKVR